MHSKYGTFTMAASDATKVVELDIAPAGHPQDVILKLNSNRTKILFAVRPRESQSSRQPVGIGEWRLSQPIADEWLECFFINLELLAKGCAMQHFIKPGEPRGSKRAQKTTRGRALSLPDGPDRSVLCPMPNVALQPQAASGEASYMINELAFCFRSDATQQEEFWLSCAEVLAEEWEGFFFYPVARKS